MSDKDPFVLRNSKPHEVAYSEVTGKITRKVNRFKEDPEPKSGQQAPETTTAEAGRAAEPERITASPAGLAAQPVGASVQAAAPVSPVVSRAAAGRSDGGRLHAAAGPAETAAETALPEQADTQVLPDTATTVAAAGPAQSVARAEPAVAGHTANVQHANVEPAAAAAVVTVAEQPGSAPDEFIAPPATAADAANMLHPETADPEAETVVIAPAPTGGAETTLMADAGHMQAPNIVQPAAEIDTPNIVHPDATPAAPAALTAVDDHQPTIANVVQRPEASVAADANTVHPAGAGTAAETLLPVPAPQNAADTTLSAGAASADSPHQLMQAVAAEVPNIVHPEAESVVAAVLVPEPADQGTDDRMLAAVEPAAAAAVSVPPVAVAAVAQEDIAVVVPAVANIMRPGHTVADDELTVAPPSRSDSPNVVIEEARRAAPGVVSAEPKAGPVAAATLVVPPHSDAAAGAALRAAVAAPVVAPAVAVAVPVLPAAAAAVPASAEKATASVTMKISAKVENHLHAVEAETARISQQLERLNAKFAAVEKAHKK